MSAHTILIKDGKKYGGQYVATRSFKDRRVVSFGKNPAKVLALAIAKGFKKPVIVYVPKDNLTHIFNAH